MYHRAKEDERPIGEQIQEEVSETWEMVKEKAAPAFEQAKATVMGAGQKVANEIQEKGVVKTGSEMVEKGKEKGKEAWD